MGQELDRARLVFYGYAVSAKLSSEPGALPGSGATEFRVEKIVKSDPQFPLGTSVTLARYVPVLDSKDPPRFLVFCNVVQGKLDPYLGRQTKTRAVVDYVEEARAERAKGKQAALRYYARFLDHADDLIAEDAFLEFARSGDQEVGHAAKSLNAAQLRKLLRKPMLDADRISMFAFLLGNCGDAGDAAMLKKRIESAQSEDMRALDGLLGGFIALRPREGWQLTKDILADRRAGFLKKYAALRTVRFYMGWQPARTKPAMLGAYQQVVSDGEMADLAIEDLRRWKAWDLTPLILSQYGKASHDAPIVKRGIVRYALCCPLAEARGFLERIRGRDGELVRDIAESLEFERGEK